MVLTKYLLLMCLSTMPVAAQVGTDYLREHVRNMEFIDLGGARYLLEASPSASGAVLSLKSLDGQVLASLSMPWQFNGGMVVRGDHAVLGGLRLDVAGRRGVLARVSATGSPAPSLTLDVSTDYAGFDPVVMRMADDESGVFVLDSVGDRLLYFVCNTSFPPAAIVGSDVCATAAQIPALADKAAAAYTTLGGGGGGRRVCRERAVLDGG